MKIYFITMAIIFLLSLCDITFANTTNNSKPKPVSGNDSPVYTDTDKDGGNPLVSDERDTRNSNDPRDAWDHPAGEGDVSDTLGIFYEGYKAKDFLTYMTVKELDQNAINSVIELRKYLQSRQGAERMDLIIKSTVATGSSLAAIWAYRVLSLHLYGRVVGVVGGLGLSGSLMADEDYVIELEKLRDEHVRLIDDISNPEISNEEFFFNIELKVYRDSLIGFLNTIYPRLCIGEKKLKESESKFCSFF